MYTLNVPHEILAALPAATMIANFNAHVRRIIDYADDSDGAWKRTEGCAIETLNEPLFHGVEAGVSSRSNYPFESGFARARAQGPPAEVTIPGSGVAQIGTNSLRAIV